MKPNKILKDLILEVVNDQLSSGEPPETRATYHRLVKDGIEEQEAKRLIACVLASELFDVMKSQRPYDHDRYAKALNRLPELPWE
ncbi:conserved hypothetical protein [Candidatus Sulfotelmatobacter kueseliae]|uniref:Uncharacterized protein n=1 Tax=Candidatus Sulfotelmatobacter kueseliae TaxID=2042962 RepID=A0A2U3L8L1_9BACT|nr:conserved hypothetical protein [Candidatus Sulfotelmatobacter kueseliae]